MQNLTVVEAEATNITVKWLKPTGPGSATVTRYLVDFIASKSEGQTLEIPNNSSEVNVTLTGFQPYEGFMVEVQGCNLGSCGPIGRVNGKTAPIGERLLFSNMPVQKSLVQCVGISSRS